jgi:hypothetical protein
MRRDFDIPIAFSPLHGLSHPFSGALAYLDYDRAGFPYPVVPFHLNCYGGREMARIGKIKSLSATGAEIPPPSPRRCFDMGVAVAEILQNSPWSRVALLASSSWSHANLTAKHGYLFPDVLSDKLRFAELERGNYSAWKNLSLEQVEAAGQLELLNWFPLVGALSVLGHPASHLEFIESYVFNSNKVFAAFR